VNEARGSDRCPWLQLNFSTPKEGDIDGFEINLFTGKGLTTATGGDRVGVLEMKSTTHQVF
jgi:hypothetical protein